MNDDRIEMEDIGFRREENGIGRLVMRGEYDSFLGEKDVFVGRDVNQINSAFMYNLLSNEYSFPVYAMETSADLFMDVEECILKDDPEETSTLVTSNEEIGNIVDSAGIMYSLVGDGRVTAERGVVQTRKELEKDMGWRPDSLGSNLPVVGSSDFHGLDEMVDFEPIEDVSYSPDLPDGYEVDEEELQVLERLPDKTQTVEVRQMGPGAVGGTSTFLIDMFEYEDGMIQMQRPTEEKFEEGYAPKPGNKQRHTFSLMDHIIDDEDFDLRFEARVVDEPETPEIMDPQQGVAEIYNGEESRSLPVSRDDIPIFIGFDSQPEVVFNEYIENNDLRQEQDRTYQ